MLIGQSSTVRYTLSTFWPIRMGGARHANTAWKQTTYPLSVHWLQQEQAGCPTESPLEMIPERAGVIGSEVTGGGVVAKYVSHGTTGNAQSHTVNTAISVQSVPGSIKLCTALCTPHRNQEHNHQREQRGSRLCNPHARMQEVVIWFRVVFFDHLFIGVSPSDHFIHQLLLHAYDHLFNQYQYCISVLKSIPKSRIKYWLGMMRELCIPRIGTNDLMENMLLAGRYIYYEGLRVLSQHLPSSLQPLPLGCAKSIPL